MLEKIEEYMADLDDEALYAEVKKDLDAGVDKMDIMEELQKGMAKVGELFAQKEYFIAELTFSAEMFEECSKLFGDDEADGEATHGNFVLGTVYSDLHDIGKNIVKQLFKCNGFNVIDLGVDVQPKAFIEAIREYDPKVIGMSCLLTTAFDPLKDCVQQIRQAGLDKGRLIICGGAPVDAGTCAYAGADTFGKDAQDSLNQAIAYVEKNADAA